MGAQLSGKVDAYSIFEGKVDYINFVMYDRTIINKYILRSM